MNNKIINRILEPWRIIAYLNRFKIGYIVPDKLMLKCLYRSKLGKPLDLKNPDSFNSKLQWLKLYDRRPIYTTMVDKYAAKEYVASVIGGEYIVPTLGVWDSFNKIDFGKLPKQFVLKCTHDSGGIVIVRDKDLLNLEEAREKLDTALKRDFYRAGREWSYKNVPRRIIAEEYLIPRRGGVQTNCRGELIADTDDGELLDYKMMCFDGRVRCSFVCSERFSKDGLKVTFFDRNWNRMPFERHYPSSDIPIEKPIKYAEMIALAEELSKGIPFVRVDFYVVGERIYFGELTLYPGCGFEEFKPEKWDMILGKWIHIR